MTTSVQNHNGSKFDVPMNDPDAAAGLAYLVIGRLEAFQGKLSGLLKKIESEQIDQEAHSAKEEANAQLGLSIASGIDSEVSSVTNLTVAGKNVKSLKQKNDAFRKHTSEIQKVDHSLKLYESSNKASSEKITSKKKKAKQEELKRKRSELERKRDHEMSNYDQDLSRLQNTLSPAITALSRGLSSFAEGAERASSSLNSSNQHLQEQMAKNVGQNASSALEFARTLASQDPGTVALAGARG